MMTNISPLVAMSCQSSEIGRSCSVQVMPSGEVAHLLEPVAREQKTIRSRRLQSNCGYCSWSG